MTQNHSELTSIEELQLYVHNTLCEKESLLEYQFKTHARVLEKNGQPCGMQFSLKGPRSVRLEAVWATDRNIIYFYDARGERYQKVTLRNRIAIPKAA